MVPDLSVQDEVGRDVAATLAEVRMVHLRANPHSGYRAVHIIATSSGGVAVEIQIRTQMQDLYAQVSEKLADQYGEDVKYGGGPANVRSTLAILAREAGRIDRYKRSVKDERPDASAILDVEEELRAMAFAITDLGILMEEVDE